MRHLWTAAALYYNTITVVIDPRMVWQLDPGKRRGDDWRTGSDTYVYIVLMNVDDVLSSSVKNDTNVHSVPVYSAVVLSCAIRSHATNKLYTDLVA